MFRQRNVGDQRDYHSFVGLRSAHFQNTFVVEVEPLDPVRGPGHAPDAGRKVENGEVQRVTWILAHSQDGGGIPCITSSKIASNFAELLQVCG